MAKELVQKNQLPISQGTYSCSSEIPAVPMSFLLLWKIPFYGESLWVN